MEFNYWYKSTLSTVATSGSYTDLSNQPSIPAAQVNADWNAVSGVAQISNKPSLATVATSGSYNDLTSKPSIPSAQIQSDWDETNAASLDYVKNKPSLAAVATSGAYSSLTGVPSIPVVQAYDGTTQRLGAFPVFGSASVATGVATFYLTADGTSTGTALFPNSVITNSVSVTPNDAISLYGFSWVFSNSNKTLTVTVNKSSATGVIALLGINILGAPISAANGTTVKLTVWGY